MEPKTTAPKTAPTTAPTVRADDVAPIVAKRGAAKTSPAKTAPKRAAKGAAKTTPTRTPKGTPKPKGTAKPKAAAKAAPKTPTGPGPERIRLAKTVAGLRAKGTKWNEIAATTGKSEPTLAKLRKDVRNGVFAKISPAKDRTPASGAGSF